MRHDVETLPLFVRRDTTTTEADVERLVERLEAVGGWVPASWFAAFGWNDRKVRAIANKAPDRVISGQLGYRATSGATSIEIDRAADRIERQGRRMIVRAAQIRSAKHRSAER